MRARHVSWAALVVAGITWSAGADLGDEDRAALEKYLGSGVVGAAVPGNPIADTSKFFPFEERSWTFRFATGDKKGQTEKVTFEPNLRDPSGTSGKLSVGSGDIMFLRRHSDGSITVTSEEDLGESVITRYTPPEFFYAAGMKPGDAKTRKIEVKVFDLHHPDHLSHSGSLDLTYNYLGAYQVTVPAGTFEAALVRWDYRGKIGPADIEDTQYRFLNDELGVLAMIEKKNISAVLIYHDHSKYGRLLVESR